MRTTIARLIVPVAAIAMACAKGASSPATVSDDLQKDLQAASASKLELAGQNGYKPMRFVSEIEQSNGAEPVVASRVPRRVAAKSAGPAPEEKRSPTPEPREDTQVAQAPAPQAESPAPSTDVPSVPIVAPRPAPMPVDMPVASSGGSGGYGSGGGVGDRGEGRGEGIGGIIGVVIRGGGVGVDHCDPRPRRGRHPWINP